LLPGNNDGLDRVLTTQTWHYPGRDQCLECHTTANGRTLGPTTAQMNRDFAYPAGAMNQIDKFDSLGLFDVRPKDIAAYPVPSDTATGTLDQRARSYLQSNCSICHRPGGPLSDVDLRYLTPFANTQLCNAPIIRGTGDPSVPQVRLVPGAPSMSTISFRMHDTGVYRMPKIGSLVVDPTGAQLIDDWITSITACP
jgi:mono/diheme cytochrome c family protein